MTPADNRELGPGDVAQWFVPLSPGADDAVPLFVFPHAGGGPGSLTPLAGLFGAGVHPWAVNLPGRQARRDEPPSTDLDALVERLATEILPLSKGPFALFGYCGGALLAYLLARRLDAAGNPPARLFVASATAPDVWVPPRRLHLLPSERFWHTVLAQGGVPPELAEQVELRPVFEPALRADFALLAAYRHVAAPPMPCGITVLHGRSDTEVSHGGLLGWRRQTRQPLALRELAGTHWLVDEAPAEVAEVITDEIGRIR